MDLPALDIKNLNKTYKGGFQALDNIDLQVQQGDFYALLGPNGAGKSTIISTITDLSVKSSGSLSIFGVDFDTNKSKAKQMIGVVPQEFNFNGFETAFNIMLNQASYYGVPRKIAKKRAEVLLKKMSLWEHRKKRGFKLSGGMKRRLMIARALIHNPKLLLLDEPTAGVDIEIRTSMWKYLQKLNREGLTIILTTHYLEEAENLCNRIAIINYGKIIRECDMPALLNSLDSESFILTLKHPIETLPSIDSVSLNMLSSTELELSLCKKHSIDDVMTTLRENGLKIDRIRSKQNRLEQLFLNLIQSEKN